MKQKNLKTFRLKIRLRIRLKIFTFNLFYNKNPQIHTPTGPTFYKFSDSKNFNAESERLKNRPKSASIFNFLT